MNSARKIKVRIKQTRPRNPLVAPALLRKAGAHKKTAKSERQAGKRKLQRELQRERSVR